MSRQMSLGAGGSVGPPFGRLRAGFLAKDARNGAPVLFRREPLRGRGKTRHKVKRRPRGLKPAIISGNSRGPFDKLRAGSEGPLFHGTASVGLGPFFDRLGASSLAKDSREAAPARRRSCETVSKDPLICGEICIFKFFSTVLESVFYSVVLARGTNSLGKKFPRGQELTPGAEARALVERLSGTTEVVPFPDLPKSSFLAVYEVVAFANLPKSSVSVVSEVVPFPCRLDESFSVVSELVPFPNLLHLASVSPSNQNRRPSNRLHE